MLCMCFNILSARDLMFLIFLRSSSAYHLQSGIADDQRGSGGLKGEETGSSVPVGTGASNQQRRYL